MIKFMDIFMVTHTWAETMSYAGTTKLQKTHHSHGSNDINSSCSWHKNSHTYILLFLLTVCGNRTGDGTYSRMYVMNSVVWSRTCAMVAAQKPAATSEHLKTW